MMSNFAQSSMRNERIVSAHDGPDKERWVNLDPRESQRTRGIPPLSLKMLSSRKDIWMLRSRSILAVLLDGARFFIFSQNDPTFYYIQREWSQN